ncbi:hypothetical protein KR054_011904, partial [Drosophila jambulina]
SGLAPRILSEHNYTVVPPEVLPSKRNLRQLICCIHARTSPVESKKLPSAELNRLVRNGDVLLRRLRRLLHSRRRFIDFEPMKPLQEAIAQELAKGLGCQTRFYNGWNDSRYMVAYRPGVVPNALEMRARRMCQKDRVLEIFSVEEEEEEECRMEPMSFRDDKLNWHQPMEFRDHTMAANSGQDSLSLGRKILEEFNREPNRKQLKRISDKE